MDDNLAKKGIDPRELKVLRQRIETLKKEIQEVESRRDELTEWLRFIKVDYGTLRQEQQNKESALSQLNRELLQKNSNYRQSIRIKRQA